MENDVKQWQGFKGDDWKENIDVSSFIDQNYTEYLGDDSFLAPKTQKTTIVWNKCKDLLEKETQNGGCLDVETNILSGITAFAPGYIDKPNEVIVGLQTDAPLKRIVNMYGGTKIALKALDVAKNPKISNYYFMVLYKKLIAEIFLIKGDMESAKMYIEKALRITKKYNMKLLKVSVYQLYAKYLEEMVSKKPQNAVTYAQNAITAYKKALSLAQALEIDALTEDVQRNLNSFKTFCQLNNIKI